MWLILCSAHDDAAADWAYRGLKSRGLEPLEVVHAEALPYGLRWDHRIGIEGASISVELRDGRRITSGRLRGVLNRLTHVPTQHLSMSPDHEYISQELTAFFMSWLHALPGPVLNRPTAQGLCGPWRHASEWAYLAGRAGLPVPVYRQSSGDQIDETRAERRLFPPGTPTASAVFLGGRLYGPQALPREVEEACARLSALTSLPLLGVEFARGEGGAWQFAGATPLPDLSVGGTALLDALAAELGGANASEAHNASATRAAAPAAAVHAAQTLEAVR